MYTHNGKFPQCVCVCIVNTMAADGLASASAVLFLTCFLWKIAVAVPDLFLSLSFQRVRKFVLRTWTRVTK